MSKKQKEQMYVRHPIRFKIFLVSLLPTLALLAGVLVNNQYLNALGDSAEQILSKNYKSIRAAQEARKALESIRNLMLAKVSGGKNASVPEEMLETVSLNLSLCRENVTEVGEKELIDQLFYRFSRYRSITQSLEKSKDTVWPNHRFSAFLNLTAEMVKYIDDLVAINEDAMERAEQQTRLLAKQAQRNAYGLFGIIITVILVLSYFLSYRVAKPIMMLARRLSAIQEGSGFYPRVKPQTNDEIGFLTESFNRLFQHLERYDHHRDEILAAEKDKVRRSEEAKVRFIADISHQLKTPMTSLAMSVGMLHRRGDFLDSDKRSRLIDTAQKDCSRLTALINELVDASRLETMSRPRPKETLNIALVIKECLLPLMRQAENRGVSIEIDIAENLPPVTIDSFRFPWVVTNLVGNALRYTERGGRIVLKIYKRGKRFYFQCIDTGSGIDPQYLPHIFDRFTQFSERGKSGTIGLGLAIVKDIIEQHGGDIQVQSRIGEGTTFTFWIPASVEQKHGESTDHR
jgi:signal transduction histidine kinase